MHVCLGNPPRRRVCGSPGLVTAGHVAGHGGASQVTAEVRRVTWIRGSESPDASPSAAADHVLFRVTFWDSDIMVIAPGQS